jgi:hypothetical protein
MTNRTLYRDDEDMCESVNRNNVCVYSSTSMDIVPIDSEINAVWCKLELEENQKWYIYKIDPLVKNHQFEFETREDKSGNKKYVLKHTVSPERFKWFRKYWKYLKYSFGLIGPLLGVGCNLWCKS